MAWSRFSVLAKERCCLGKGIDIHYDSKLDEEADKVLMGKVNELQEREAEQEVVELEEAENLEEGEESLKKGKGRKCFLCPLWLNGPTQMDDHSIGKSISNM